MSFIFAGFGILLSLGAFLGGLASIYLLFSHSKLKKKVLFLEESLIKNNAIFEQLSKEAEGMSPHQAPSEENSKIHDQAAVEKHCTIPIQALTDEKSTVLYQAVVEKQGIAPSQAPAEEQGKIPDQTGEKEQSKAPDHKKRSFSQIYMDTQYKHDDKSFDLEAFIGAKLLGWLSFFALIAGSGFFLKLAYDQGWIGPAARIAIVMLAGLFGTIYSEKKLRKDAPIVASSLTSASITAIYLAIYFSYYYYNFIDQSTTFFALAYFALFAVYLAYIQDSKTMATLGFFGAYIVPSMLSTGQDSGEILLSYLAVTGFASVLLASKKNWNIPNFTSLILMMVNIFGWYQQFGGPNRLWLALTGFFLLYLHSALTFFIPSTISKNKPKIANTIILILGLFATLVGFWDALYTDYPLILGLVLACLSASISLLLILGDILKIQFGEIRAILTLIGFAVLLMTIPAYFRGHIRPVAISIASFIIIFVGIKTDQNKISSLGSLGLVLALFFGLLEGPVHSGYFRPILNPVFINWFFIISCWLFGAIINSSPDNHKSQVGFIPLAGFLSAGTYFLFLLLISYECNSFFNGAANQLIWIDYPLFFQWKRLCFLAILGIYPAILLLRIIDKPNFSFIHYLLNIGLFYIITLRINFSSISLPFSLPFANIRFLAMAFLPAGLYLSSRCLKRSMMNKRAIASASLFHLLSSIIIAHELYHYFLLGGLFSSHFNNWAARLSISLSIGIYGAFLLAGGIKMDLGWKRKLALLMLTFCVTKVFLFDSIGLGQIFRVLSFIIFGIILMISSKNYSIWLKKRDLS